MQIENLTVFLKYYGNIKRRTRRLFPYIPADKIEWAYKEGKFTIGDLIRHLANIERYMYAETVQNNHSRYKGCGVEYAQSYENVLQYYDDLHEESMRIFSSLTSEQLNSKCKTPAGTDITVWKWLRAMVEHEVHHRGQLYVYLGMLGVETPPLYGLTSEEVAGRSV